MPAPSELSSCVENTPRMSIGGDLPRSPQSPRTPGALAAGLALAYCESPRGRELAGVTYGSPRSGRPDRRTICIDHPSGVSGFRKGPGANAEARHSPHAGTKFTQIGALKAHGLPYHEMGLDALPARRRSLSPGGERDRRNFIVQQLDAYEMTGIIGRRAPLSRSPSRGPEPLPPRALSPRERALSPQRKHMLRCEDGDDTMIDPMFSNCDGQKQVYMDGYPKGSKKLESDKTMKKSLRRLDAAAAKLEAVAKALVQEAHRQSLKRVA
eukprot:TRINITY_DN50134_c0_g1_i1.p1 TRINITY_DN50134_c0_g1~~TRINITY_DN50134_c0_g1_i1.p1  ORF type:complete len:268 (+),score=62.55 TRINITY_DN50134_c0_g1_i1:73-876(+)